VRAGGGDGERSLGVRLAAHVGEVRRVYRVLDPGLTVRDGTRDRLPARHVRTYVEQARRGIDDGRARERRLARARFRQHERVAVAARVEGHRQRTADRSQCAGQRQLARKFVARERRGRQLLGGGENAERDRQIEAARFLRQIRRCEIHRDLAGRKIELRVLQRGAHALARFLHLGFWKTDKVERRQPAGEMHLDGDQRRVDAGEAARENDGERHDVEARAPAPPGRRRCLVQRSAHRRAGALDRSADATGLAGGAFAIRNRAFSRCA
jgi:hypothetical protein